MSLASLFGIGEVDNKLTGVNMIDFSQIVISTLTATFEPDEEINIDMMRHLCLNTLRSNIHKTKKLYPKVIICVDSKGGYWRREVAYYYKKHRTKQREESKFNWEAIFLCLNTVIAEIKENMPYHVIDKDLTEADDVIGVMVKYFSENHPLCNILITSSDGDFTQLHKYKNVKQWSPMMKKWVKCKHGSPRNDLRFKIIKGDKKDAIAGILSPSDYVITRQDGEKAPAISTAKLLEPLMKSDDPYSLLSGDMLARYKENEMLLDFDFIPDYISSAIIDEYENGHVAPRSKMYPYFVSKRLVKLTNSVNEF